MNTEIQSKRGCKLSGLKQGKCVQESLRSQHTEEFCSKPSRIFKPYLLSVSAHLAQALNTETQRSALQRVNSWQPNSFADIRGVITRDEFGHRHLHSVLDEQEQLP